MSQNKFQKMVFAFITVVITVHAYVFYSLYVVNGQTLMSLTGAGSVLGAIKQLAAYICSAAIVPSGWSLR